MQPPMHYYNYVSIWQNFNFVARICIDKKNRDVFMKIEQDHMFNIQIPYDFKLVASICMKI